MKKIYLITINIIILNTLLAAQPGSSTTMLGRWAAGPPYAFIVEDNIIYTANGGILQILSISNPSEPQLLGQVSTDGIITDVAKEGNYIYLAEQDSGLKIIDVSNLADPVQVSELFLQGPVNGLVVNNQTLFILEGEYYDGIQWLGGGLRIVNITSPSNPQTLGFYDSPNESHHISLVGDYVYIDNFFIEILIIDISDLLNPTLVGSDSVRFGNSYLSENLLYVGSGYPDVSGLKIFDVTDPINPSLVSHTIFDGGVEDIIVSEGYAYITIGDYWDGNTWREGQIKIFDVSDPVNPQEIGFYESSGDVSSVSKSGNTLIISEGTFSASFSGNEDGSGLRFLNVIIPSQPQPIGFYATPGWGESVTVRDGYAFVLTRFGGMSIVDLQNISDPIQVGYYNSPGLSQQVVLQDNFAYLADGLRGIRVVDISDLTNPFEVGSFETGGFFYKVDVSGNYAYTLSYTDGLHILDVSDPTNIYEVSFFQPQTIPLAILVRGNYAYFAEGYIDRHWGGTVGWIKIIDISNPSNPVLVGEYFDTGGPYYPVFYPTDFDLAGNYLYVANEVGSLRVFDVSDPTNPVVVSNTPTFAKDIEVEENFAYLTHFNGDIRIFDVSDPYNPEEIDLYERQFYVTDIDVKNGRIYASAFDYGMMILHNEITTSIEEEEVTIPAELALSQNYPNPFNPFTTIKYSLPSAGFVSLKVFDIIGNEIATLENENKLAGNYEIDFGGYDLATGVYVYVLRFNNKMLSRKMILLK